MQNLKYEEPQHVGNLGDTDVYKDSLGIFIKVDGETVWCSDEENTTALVKLLQAALGDKSYIGPA